MSENDKSFNVSDRRHFTPDGRPREDAAGDATSEPSRTNPPPAPGPGASTGPPVDFSHFLLGLAAQAGMLLSPQESAPGDQPGEALEGARSIISILEMLEDKTEGRRTPSESALLDDLLFQLRMAYVDKTRTGGA